MRSGQVRTHSAFRVGGIVVAKIEVKENDHGDDVARRQDRPRTNVDHVCDTLPLLRRAFLEDTAGCQHVIHRQVDHREGHIPELKATELAELRPREVFIFDHVGAVESDRALLHVHVKRDKGEEQRNLFH